ncbi:NINE protein [Fructobacillus papyrifericola]|uniref:NINE protein n=1 Tax=Fructobacillus papyrifericola TaxID=2713172 RepID=A0ABS5QT63_9LACO|nr:NINE protein [Fructobacillus papyrifericola]MBS9336388.1 NINE protein [Fructobacillus papyrifericola]
MVEKTMNKHVFVWVGAFLFGLFGVDRFMRGQIGIGILKLVIEAGTFGFGL